MQSSRIMPATLRRLIGDARRTGGRSLRSCLILVLVVALGLLASPRVSADPGDLDSSFSGDGVATTNLTSGNDLGQAVARDSAGVTYVASESWNGTSVEMRVTALAKDGSVLTITSEGFGNDLSDYPLAIATVEANGERYVYVAGRTWTGDHYDVAVAKMIAYGTPDSPYSFSLSSVSSRTYAIAASDASALAIAPQPDGKLVLAGSVGSGSSTDFLVLRILGDLKLDTSFSGDGWTTTSMGTSMEQASGVALQGDGKIVAAGYMWGGDAADFDVAVARFSADGSLDTTFNGTGKVVTAVGPGRDVGRDVAVDPDSGKIVVGGSTTPAAGGDDFFALRYTATGGLDASFSGDGKVTTSLTDSGDVAYSLSIAANKIVLAGNAAGDAGVVRYLSNGSLDSTFSTDGRAAQSFTTGTDLVYDSLVDASGAVVLTGTVSNGSTFDTAVARLTAAGAMDPTFAPGGTDGVDGLAIYDISGTLEEHGGVEVLSDGKVLAYGPCGADCHKKLVALRYTQTGDLDRSFSSDGIAAVSLGSAGITDEWVGTTAVAANTSGRTVVAGLAAKTGSSSMVIAALRSDGSLDTTFDGDGLASVSFGTDYLKDHGSLVVNPDGSVLVGFDLQNFGDPEEMPSGSYVMRLTSSGSRDTSFGFGGMALVARPESGYELPEVGDMGVQSSGRVLVSVHSCTQPVGMEDILCSAWTTALTSNGRIDRRYGVQGKASVVDRRSYGTGFTRLDIAPDGRTVVSAFPFAAGTVVVAMLTATGQLDTGFGTGGLIKEQYSPVYAPAFAPDGKVVLAGDGKLRRYTAQGQLDTTFGNGGELDSPVSSFSYQTSVDVTADGRPVVAGMVQSHCYGTVVAPYPARCFKFDAGLARFQS